MKFTSEDLMKAMGLQVGDRVKVYDRIYELKETNIGYYFDIVNEEIHSPNLRCSLIELLNEDYEILPRPKRVGDLKCKTYKDCDNCPLRILFCERSIDDEDTLYEILNRWTNEYVNFDPEIHDLLKDRLDKVVE